MARKSGTCAVVNDFCASTPLGLPCNAYIVACLAGCGISHL
jgi:hypothetical protein